MNLPFFRMMQVFDTCMLTISGMNLLFHLFGAYLLISVYNKGKKKKSVQQLLLISLSLTELSISFVFLTEMSLKIFDKLPAADIYTVDTLCNRSTSNDFNPPFGNQPGRPAEPMRPGELVQAYLSQSVASSRNLNGSDCGATRSGRKPL